MVSTIVAIVLAHPLAYIRLTLRSPFRFSSVKTNVFLGCCVELGATLAE